LDRQHLAHGRQAPGTTLSTVQASTASALLIIIIVISVAFIAVPDRRMKIIWRLQTEL
jgi:hypothetical protein